MNRYFRLLSYLKPYRLFVAGAFCCGALFALFTASYAWLMQPLLDDLFIRKDREMIRLLPLAIIGVSLLKGLASYGQNYLWQYIGLKIVSDIREGLYRHLIFMPIASHSKHPTGALMSYILNDVNLLQTAASTVVKNIVSQPITLVALAGVIFYRDATLALLAIVVIPLFIIPLSKIGARLKKFAFSGQEKIGVVSAHLQETLSGIRVVKTFGKEQFEASRFEKKNRAYLQEIIHATAISEIAPPLMETMGAIGVSMIIGYAGFQVINETMTAGQFFSFLTATMLMYGPLKILASSNNMLQQSVAAAERVFFVLDEKNEEQQDQGTQEVQSVSGELLFQNVSFSYNRLSSPALQNIDFKISAGTTIALVGHSGAGAQEKCAHLPRRIVVWDEQEQRELVLLSNLLH
jgi:subfamily B ATP-binding cassette protein MsbA